MAYDASPSIISKYKRQSTVDSRPGTSQLTDDLDESSLAAWWNIDKTINLNNNTTPFRKQRYEPIKWANAHLLLDEDGAEFLVDDPFATPAPVVKSAKKPSSARKRNSNITAGYPKSSNRMSAGSHRNLTLADLTPRSRRLSGFRPKTPQQPRTSEPNIRPLRLSFNGPTFAPKPYHDLEVIQEHHSRQGVSPLLPAFRPLPPERIPESPPPVVACEPHSNVSPTKTAASIRTPTRPSRPLDTRSVVNDTKQRRKSGRGSIPSAGPSQPTQNVPRVESDSDEEELHKSIPGAFDFVAFERFKPLANTVLQERAPKLPRRSNTMDAIKPGPSIRPSEPAMKRAITVPGTSNSGLSGILAEYGNSLTGLLRPNPTQPATKQSEPPVKPSQLSPRRPAATRPQSTNQATAAVMMVGKAIAPMNVAARSPSATSPTKAKPASRASTVAPPSRLQKPSQTQLGGKPAPTKLGGSTVPSACATARPSEDLSETRPSAQIPSRPKPRSRSHPHPPSTVHEGLLIQVSEVTTNLVPQTIPTEAVNLVHRPRTSTGRSSIVMRTSPFPSPQEMHLDSSPVIRASPVKSRPSTSRSVAGPTGPIVLEPSHRRIKPILKKRLLEVSPAKVGIEERAKKRQKFADVSTVRNGGLTAPLDRCLRAEESGRAAPSKRGKLELAPRKQGAHSRSRTTAEAPALGPLVLLNAGVGSPSMHRNRSRSRERNAGFGEAMQDARDRSRSQSRVGRQNMDSRGDIMTYAAAQAPSQGLEEDVFGTVMDNSLEAVAVARASPKYSLLPPRHILEGTSPIRIQQEPISVPLSRQERSRLAGDNQPALNHILQPSTTYNSPKRTRAPSIATQKPTSPVRIDYKPKSVDCFTKNPFVTRTQDHVRDDAGCRLTIPVSPKFMRARREKEREEHRVERERERERERPVMPIVRHKERPTITTQREMPPVAAALLAKLAGFEADLTRHRTRDTAQAITHQFTFKSELRKDGAVLADRTLKQQFESRRNLWEQRSLEASQESRTSSLDQSRPRSRGPLQRARQVQQRGSKYQLPTASTSSRAAEREVGRDFRRRDGGTRREERRERVERVPARNCLAVGLDDRPW